jgi:hypothetical protein
MMVMVTDVEGVWCAPFSPLVKRSSGAATAAEANAALTPLSCLEEVTVTDEVTRSGVKKTHWAPQFTAETTEVANAAACPPTMQPSGPAYTYSGLGDDKPDRATALLRQIELQRTLKENAVRRPTLQAVAERDRAMVVGADDDEEPVAPPTMACSASYARFSADRTLLARMHRARSARAVVVRGRYVQIVDDDQSLSDEDSDYHTDGEFNSDEAHMGGKGNTIPGFDFDQAYDEDEDSTYDADSDCSGD